MPILSSGDFDEVRAALGTDIDANDLPDAVIARDVYQGAGEREVVALLPQPLNSYSGADAAHIKSAAVFMTAARLALRLTRVTSERIASWSASYLNQDPELIAASLRAQAMAELGAITGALKDLTSSIAPRPMTLAPGGRGDVRSKRNWLADPFWRW